MLETLDYSVIVIFLIATVAVGLWFARRSRGSAEFFLAGRNLTWPFIGLSLFATNISAEHFVGLAGDGHRLGLVAGGYEWIASYCLIMLAMVFAPQYVRHKVFTIPEFFEKRYGIETRMALTVYFLAMIILTKVSIAVFTGALVIEEFTGWDTWTIMWTIGVLTAIYTMLGGLRAVIYTDFIQSIVLIGGATLLTFLALDAVGGWSGLVHSLETQNKTGLLSMVKPSDDPDYPFTGYLLGNFLIGGMFYWCMDQVNVQRVLGAKNVHHATSGAIFAGFLKILPVFIMCLPGVIAVALFDDPTSEFYLAEGNEEHNKTFPRLIQALLSPGVRGLVLAALLAALMSSLSSSFNSVATIAGRDLLARFRPDAPVRRQVLVGQIALVLVMVIGILATPLIKGSETIWKHLQVVTGYLSVPFATAGLLGVLSRRINRPGVLAGIGMGVVAGTLLFLDGRPEDLDERVLSHPIFASFLHRTFLSAVLTSLTMVVVSYLTAPPPQEVRDGSFYLFRRVEDPSQRLRPIHWIWIGTLFVIVTMLWVIFR
jgi:SSS family solute:Na+ symporter